MKYIVSFTTSPLRIYKCYPMIKSILNQSRKPDLILLNLPYIFERTNQPYNIPHYISNDLSDDIIINRVNRDYGPGTKIIPTISYLKYNGYDANDTYIIYLDDDIRYPKNMIQIFESNNNSNNSNNNLIWCSSGLNFSKSNYNNINYNINGVRNHNKNCMIAEGYGGVCVKLSIFEDDFYLQ